jgi:copper homeostasis protein
MVRPRIGDFCYTEDEIQVMLHDIELFKKHKVHGIVIGALTPEGSVDLITLEK